MDQIHCPGTGGSKAARRAPWVGTWVLVLVAFVALRIDFSTGENSMDERIVLAVSQGMSDSSRLDPNWVFASPHYYRYPQYNFYSYNILSHFLIVLSTPLHVAPITVLRVANVVYQLCALGLTVLTLRRLKVAAAGILAAAALMTFMPGMVHDAHIARCESLLYLLFAAATYSAVTDRMLAGGLILGFGAAAKVTFLATGLLFVPTVLVGWKSHTQLLRRAATIGLATIAGFALSAPYAVINYPILISGLARIRNIYLATNPQAHRLLHPTTLRNVAHAWAFLTIVYGSLVVAGFVSPLFNRARVALGVWLSSVAVVAYFATVPFFIERNFSLAIFGFAVLLAVWIGCGRAQPLAVAMFAAAFIPMSYWSVQIALASYERPGARRAAWQAAHVHEPVTYFWSAKPNFADEVPKCSGLLGIPDLNDDFSRRLLDYLQSTGRQEAAHYRSRFSIVPTSTLHTYLDTDMYYFACGASK